jgi:hypothetical protein
MQYSELQYIEGRDKMGRIYKYYSEDDVIRICGRLSEDLPKADKTGFFELEGRRFGNIRAFAREFESTSKPVGTRIKSAGIEPIKGKDVLGRLSDFYPEDSVRRVCDDLLNSSVPQADESGFFEKGGIRYGTLQALSRILGINRGTIRKKAKQCSVKPLKGRNTMAHLYNFYPEPSIRSACADLIQDLPQADESNFFEIEGIRHGTIKAWSRLLPISETAITKHLQKFGASAIPGKASTGRKSEFYSEPDVLRICASLLDDLPQADEDGFFEKGDIRYGTICAWSREFPISERTIQIRLQKSNHPSIPGKARMGQRHDFYSESDVLTACADLLEKRNPHAA